LYDATGRLLYVGITCDLQERWKDHAQDKKAWWSEVTEKRAQWYPERGEAERDEVHAIVTEYPLHNTQMNNDGFRELYRSNWLDARFAEDEKALCTPRKPWTKSGKAALEDLRERRALAQRHMAGRCWTYDGRQLLEPYWLPLPNDTKTLMTALIERSRRRVIHADSWWGCHPWPTEAIVVETRHMRGERSLCPGEPRPCATPRAIAARYKDHHRYPYSAATSGGGITFTP